jgi:hypothetical protein
MSDPCTHNWTATENGWACTNCPDTTTSCTECGTWLETNLTVCNRCLNSARKIITDIHQWMTEHTYGVSIVTLRAIRYDRDKITAGTDDERLPFGLDAVIPDPEDTRITALKHPDDAIAILHDWAASWANTRTDTIPPGTELDYLTNHTLWAIQNPDDSAWHQYVTEARQVRSTVRRLLGIAPEREPVPCVHCGGRVIRDWTPDGLDDLRRCTRCGMDWPNKARLDHTNAQVLHDLPNTHPDALVTSAQARRVHPQLNAATLRSWVHRNLLEPQGHDVRGEPLYRLGDITARHERTA